MKIFNKKNIGLILITFIVIPLLIDFINFYRNIFSFTNNAQQSNNLIVLTGGTNRIKQTLEIFFNKYPTKNILLVSGAGTGFNKNIMSTYLPNNKNAQKVLNCCINIENISKNTKTNAIESFKWIKKNNFKSITLITSDYHMQRSLVEFKKIFGEINIIPFVLRSDNSNIRAMYNNYFVEYLKFLIARLRFI